MATDYRHRYMPDRDTSSHSSDSQAGPSKMVRPNQTLHSNHTGALLESSRDMSRPGATPPPHKDRESHKHSALATDSETEEPRRTKSRFRTRSGSRSRRSSTTTETLALILSDRLNYETSRVTQLTVELEDQRRDYTMLLGKYTALQTTCTKLQVELQQYKAKFREQQTEIHRAQDIVEEVDRKWRNAEDDAARGRQKLRHLKADLAVKGARDGGWRQGFHQGAREAGMVLNGLLGKVSSNTRSRRDDVLDEDYEDGQEGRRRSRSRHSSSRHTTSNANSSSSRTETTEPLSVPPDVEQTRPETPPASRRGLRAGLADVVNSRRRSISRPRSRANSAPDRPLSAFEETEVQLPQPSGIPDVPSLPPRPSTAKPPSFNPVPQPGYSNEGGMYLAPGRAPSDTSTRISDLDLVSPPRSRHPEQGPVSPIPIRPYMQNPNQRSSTQPEISSRHPDSHSHRRHTFDIRVQGARTTTPRINEIRDPRLSAVMSNEPSPPDFNHLEVPGQRSSKNRLSLLKRLPLNRNQSSGTVQIAVEPPSRSPSDPSPTSVIDPVMLSPDAAESYELEDDNGLNTAGLLDAISKDQDTSYFPFGRTTPPNAQPEAPMVYGAGPSSRSTTPRNGGRMTPKQTYDAAPVPQGVVYPTPVMPPGTAPPTPSSSSSASTASPPPPPSHKGKSARRQGKSQSLSGVSPATLNRHFSMFPQDA